MNPKLKNAIYIIIICTALPTAAYLHFVVNAKPAPQQPNKPKSPDSSEMKVVDFSRPGPPAPPGSAGSAQVPMDPHEGIFPPPEPDDVPPRKALYLSSSSPQDAEGAHRGLLLREIARQALLLAARDELGMRTWDESLRQPEPKSSSAILEVRTTALPAQGDYRLVVHWRANEAEKFRRDMKINSTDRVAYLLGLVTEAERMSRAEIPTWLRTRGLSGKRNRKSEMKLPGIIDMDLQRMRFMVQFGAARYLHALIRLKGESAGLVGGLVRVYANLGVLMSPCWSVSHKVFKARSLLYAERLFAASPGSAQALWHRAYARALSGLHGPALEDIESAKSLKETPPPWVEMIRLFCRYDADGLLEFSRKQAPLQDTAWLLKMVSLEHCRMTDARHQAALDDLKVTPGGFRALATLCEVGGVSNLRSTIRKVRSAWFDARYSSVRQRADSPPSIAEYLHPRKFEEPSRRGNIASILLTVEPQEADRGEPSWSALGAMIQEYSYLFGYYELNLRRNIWSVDTSRAMEEVRIAAKGHPLLNFLESFNLKRSQMDKYSDLLDRIAVVDADVQMMPMIRVMRYAQLARKAPSVFMDSIAGDLEQGLNKMGLPLNTQVKLAKVLRHVSPYSPAAYATLIENDWTNSEPQIADWDREHGHQFEVAAALARRYLATGRTEEAKSKLERLISVSKDKWAFTELARIHKASGNVDEWKAVLDEYLKKGADSGLQKTSVRVELANHYMGRGEYEKAEPYAGEAAKSWAAWAMLTATKCYEKLGRWNDAELWIRRTSERYQESQLIWFFWCKRTGHGDAFAASKLGDKMIKRLEKEGRADYVSHRTAAFYLMSDRPDEALKFYLRLHKAGDGLAGIFAALLSEELELPATRDDAFLLAQLARGKDPLVAGLASLVTEIETGGLVTGLPIEKLKRLIDSKRRAEALGKLPCRQAARRARLS